jgi:hypothetical protein
MLNESKIHNSKSIITRPSEPVPGNYEAEKKTTMSGKQKKLINLSFLTLRLA